MDLNGVCFLLERIDLVWGTLVEYLYFFPFYSVATHCTPPLFAERKSGRGRQGLRTAAGFLMDLGPKFHFLPYRRRV